MVSSIHVVAHEQVIRVRCFTSVAKEFHQVVELPVNVPADRNWAFDRLHIGLFHQNFPRFVAELFHFLLGERFALSEVFDLRVQVRVRIARSSAGHVFHHLDLQFLPCSPLLHAGGRPFPARASGAKQGAPPPRTQRQTWFYGLRSSSSPSPPVTSLSLHNRYLALP
eukprot:scaffold967_cov321-Pavlova_lutheri.AAC.22